MWKLKILRKEIIAYAQSECNFGDVTPAYENLSKEWVWIWSTETEDIV